MPYTMEITKPKRTFLPESLNIDQWEKLEPFFNQLLAQEINSPEAFKTWLKNLSELEAVLEEDVAWRYIKMTIDTTQKELSDAYNLFVTEIQPKIAPLEDAINKKLSSSPFKSTFENDQAYKIMFRSIDSALQLYREENIPIISKVSEEAQKYGSIAAEQSIEYNGESMTMQKAGTFLRETDESVRKEVFEKIVARRIQDTDKFNDLFDRLLEKRHQIAVNAGFKNFRDYKMESLGRFDYTVEDCENFHSSVKELIVPIVKEIRQEQLNKLGKDKFKPWDTEVDPEGRSPLKPFQTGEELLKGTIEIFEKIDPYFADCIATMDKMKHLDLESKKGKAPGGYNYPLYEIGVPFIFMNAVGSSQDLITMVHEGGHAVHSFLSRELELTGFKNLPSEVAELASMSMELLSMEHWDVFYKDEETLNRAKKEQLSSLLKILPWIAQVDEFQHWLYVNHNHSRQERNAKWNELSKEYGVGLTDWTGYEDYLTNSWHRQLHIFEVPFYYIEYGIAQLGAVGVWKNSLVDKAKAIEQYKGALRLAYTKSIPEIYETAGIRFDFSTPYISELARFIKTELDKY